VVWFFIQMAGEPRAKSREWLSSFRHSIRQGNLSGEHLHKVKRIRGMFHGPPRQPFWLTGGLPV